MKENNKYQAKYCYHLSYLILCLIILFFSKSLQADAYKWDDMGFESQHISTFYDINAGLPFSEMNAVAQTQDRGQYEEGLNAELLPDPSAEQGDQDGNQVIDRNPGRDGRAHFFCII